MEIGDVISYDVIDDVIWLCDVILVNLTIHELYRGQGKQMQIKENTSIHPGKISLGVGRYELLVV